VRGCLINCLIRYAIRDQEAPIMEIRQSIRVIRQVVRKKRLPANLIASTTRAAIHPIERHWLDGWSFPPRSLSVMITDRCNLRCRMCQYANSETAGYGLNRSGFMALDLFQRILDTCPGKPLIGLTGGEPLLHPQAVDFIREMKRRGFLCSLTTNGSFLQARAAELSESGLDLLVVSIDGDQETHDRIRSQGTYGKAVAGIREIMKQPDRPMVAISTVITDINYKNFGRTFSLAEELGVDLLNYQHLWIHSDEMISEVRDMPDNPTSGRILWQINPQKIDGEVVYEALQSIHRTKHRLLIHEYPRLDRGQTHIYYREPEQLVKVRSSRCAWQSMKIYPDGEVGICREYHAGNVKDQPLREIWNNQKYRNFRRYLKENGTCAICSRCCLLFTRL
jgi:MoaA/NifB/PqqE/SkfB family radical SAM enzyme